MKKNVILITFMLFLLTTYAFSQNTITRDEAFKIIKQKGLVDTLTNNVGGSNQIIPPNTVIKLMTDSIISPSFTSWFFFIDLEPDADWAHPCKYIYVNINDSSLIILKNQFPVDLALELLFRHTGMR